MFTPTLGGEIEAIRALRPQTVFPIYEGGREYLYAKFAKQLSALGMEVEVGRDGI
jgi:hypothetical protein